MNLADFVSTAHKIESGRIKAHTRGSASDDTSIVVQSEPRRELFALKPHVFANRIIWAGREKAS